VKVRTQLLSPLVTRAGHVDRKELDAVTIDAFGTLVELRDPAGALAGLLPTHGRDEIEAAFQAEAAHYVAHSHEGGDAAGLARLYAECTSVFNETLGSALTPEAYVEALDRDYRVLPGVPEALTRLRALGLELAVVGNWDRRLPEQLERLGLAPHFFNTIVSSAEAGAPKPDPRPFLAALERLGVEPNRTLHVGDGAPDEEGARRAGLRFAPAPLATLMGRLR
jgi:putative hydrolase of the HAD superfamily